MISDEELKEFLGWKFDPNSHESVFQEIAQELIAYREAERAIWENAELANWYARDASWFYQRKPEPGYNGEWDHSFGEIDLAEHDGWQSTLQERPK